MIAAVAVLVLSQISERALKPWDPRSPFQKPEAAADLAEFELHFQPTGPQPPFVLEGVAKYDRWAFDDALLLGDLMFHAPKLLGPRAGTFGLSCNTCHPGGASNNVLYVEASSDCPGNVDLLSDYFYAEADDGVFAPRNIPSLRGCSFTPPYRRDGKVASLSQTNALVVGHEFQQKNVPAQWLEALTAYVARFQFQTAPAGGDRRVFDAAGCPACHAGVIFTDNMSHPGHQSAALFDTPTLLNSAESAPYFFDGSARGYDEAVAAVAPKLSKADAAALAAYLQAIGAVSEPAVAWSADERVHQALAWARLAKGPLWPLAVDTMRHQVRLALRGVKSPPKRWVELAADLGRLAAKPYSEKERLRILSIGQGAGKTEQLLHVGEN